MAVRYNNQLAKTGASVGTVVSIVRPSTYVTSSTESVESSNWNISENYSGWLECDGRTLNVSDYRALYYVIGNTYGGTPNVNFKLPDFRSKKICGTGALNGNNGASLTLTPTKNPTGTTGGGNFDIAGSTGGLYTISTIRQLPEGSEITPSNPSNPVVIGGNAIDTFSLGTFRSSGFSSIVFTVEPILSGTASFSIGPIKEVSVTGVPPHAHEITSAGRGNRRACQAPQDQINDYSNFFDESIGTVISFNRARRPWPGNQSGYGDTSSLFPISSANITYGPGTSFRAYGSGTGETGGFSTPVDSQISNFGTGYLSFGGTSAPFVENRSATITVDATATNAFLIYAIAGNDSNGGERVNSQFDSLEYRLVRGSQSTNWEILLESAWKFNNGQDLGFQDYDAEYDTWKTRSFGIPLGFDGSNLQIQFRQRVNPQGYDGVYDPSLDLDNDGDTEDATELEGANTLGDPDPPQNWYDTFGIALFGVTTIGGDTYTYNGQLPANPIQRHSHMIYWSTPNVGDVVPSAPSTYGTGGGVDNRYALDGSGNPVQLAGVGLRNGPTATEIVATNSSIGITISKTLDVILDIGNTVNPSIVTLKDSSRTSFDNAIDVRLQAAEEIILLTPYFRAKYIIKAF